MLTQSSIYKEYLDLMDTEAYIYIYIYIYVYSCQEYSDIARASFSYKTSCIHAVFSHLVIFTPYNSESEGRTFIKEIENICFGILLPSLKSGFQWFWM